MNIRYLFLAPLLLFISSCGQLENNVDTGTAQQILHLGNGAEPQGLDPHLISGVTGSTIVSELLEGLVTEHPKTLEPQPGAASSWDISEDLTTYTFHINPNAKWSNGDAVTAHDFVYSWQRLLTANLGAEYAYQLYVVKNAEAFHREEINDFTKVGVKALDDLTLQVELIAPTPYFLSMLTHASTFPVHRATIEKFGAIDDPGTKWTRAENYVGNGAFILKEWALNRIIRIVPNPHYWDADRVKLKEVRFYPIGNLVTEERMFRAKNLHKTYQLSEDKIATYRDKYPEYLSVPPYLATYFYRINTTIPVLDDVRVRRALAMTVDREQIVTAINKGGQPPAYTLTPPNTLGYTAEAKIEYDVATAQQLLAEAGYPNGEGFPTFELTYNTNEAHRKVAVAIQQMWKTKLGINITLHNKEWKTFLADEKDMKYQINRSSWVGDYVDPNTFLDMFMTGGGNNRTGFSNKEYDTLIRQAGKAKNQQQRFALFQQAEKLLMEEAPIIPIYTYTLPYAKHTDVKGWHDNILNRHPLKYVYLERDK